MMVSLCVGGGGELIENDGEPLCVCGHLGDIIIWLVKS